MKNKLLDIGNRYIYFFLFYYLLVWDFWISFYFSKLDFLNCILSGSPGVSHRKILICNSIILIVVSIEFMLMVD